MRCIHFHTHHATTSDGREWITCDDCGDDLSVNVAPPASAPETSERCATLCPVCGLKWGHDAALHREFAPPATASAPETSERCVTCGFDKDDLIHGDTVTTYGVTTPGHVFVSPRATASAPETDAAETCRTFLCTRSRGHADECNVPPPATAGELTREIFGRIVSRGVPEQFDRLMAHDAALRASRDAWVIEAGALAFARDCRIEERDAERAERQRLERVIEEAPHATTCNRGRCEGHAIGVLCACGNRPCDCFRSKAARGEGK